MFWARLCQRAHCGAARSTPNRGGPRRQRSQAKNARNQVEAIASVPFHKHLACVCVRARSLSLSLPFSRTHALCCALSRRPAHLGARARFFSCVHFSRSLAHARAPSVYACAHAHTRIHPVPHPARVGTTVPIEERLSARLSADDAPRAKAKTSKKLKKARAERGSGAKDDASAHARSDGSDRKDRDKKGKDTKSEDEKRKARQKTQTPDPSDEAQNSPKRTRDASRNANASPIRHGQDRGSGGGGLSGGGDASASTALADYRVSSETVRVLAKDNITSLFPVQVGCGCDRCV